MNTALRRHDCPSPRLRPELSRRTTRDDGCRLRPLRRAKPRAELSATRLSRRQRLALLHALIHADSFDQALGLARITRRAALGEYARDALFALAWDRALDVRLGEMKTRLVDKIARWLDLDRRGEFSEAQDKYHIALYQWVVEARAREAAASTPRAPADGPQPGGDQSAEVSALIARLEARLR